MIYDFNVVRCILTNRARIEFLDVEIETPYQQSNPF